MNDNATYTSIGFHMQMILNKLRNKQQIDGTQEQRREADSRDDEDIGRELHVRALNKKRGSS